MNQFQYIEIDFFFCLNEKKNKLIYYLLINSKIYFY